MAIVRKKTVLNKYKSVEGDACNDAVGERRDGQHCVVEAQRPRGRLSNAAAERVERIKKVMHGHKF